MRKKLRIIGIIVLFVGLVLLSTDGYATTGKSTNEYTRIRKKASTTSEIVETIEKNETVEIISEEGDWYKVKYQTAQGEIEGYIRSDLLEVKETVKKETKQEEEKEEKKEATTTEKTEIKTDKEETTKTVEIKENSVLKLSNNTQIQLLPLVYSCKIGDISANTEITVLEVIGNWCKIEAENQSGWVMKSKIAANETAETKEEETKEEEKKEEKEEKKEETKTATATKLYVITTTLNLRSKPETGDNILTQLDYGDELEVVKKYDNTWTQVKYKTYTGYAATQYLSENKPNDVTSRGVQEPRKVEEEVLKNTEKEEAKKEETKKTETTTTKKTETSTKTTTKKTTTKKETKSSSKVTGADIIAYAKKFLGCKYVYGANGPNTFDCSGFTCYVYKHFGYTLPRVSNDQRHVSGAKVIKDRSKLQLGDIVCFPGHVGLYVGGGNFIHASHTGSDVKISSLSSSYYKNKFIQGTRILK